MGFGWLWILACGPKPDGDAPGGGDDSATEGTDDDSGETDDSAASDADEDGSLDADDCDDEDPSVHPGATETCDGRDEDCDDAIDEDATDGLTYRHDVDGDGFGGAETLSACEDPDGSDLGWVSGDEDCDDTNVSVWPGASEICADGIDQDCDGLDATTACVPSDCTMVVPADGSLADVLAAAESGTIVCLQPGTYTDVVSVGTGVELRGIEGPGATILDGGGRTPVATLDGGILRGVTITGGGIPAVESDGSGLRIEGVSLLDDAIVTLNGGSGISVKAGGDVRIAGTTISQNTSDYGAGVWVLAATVTLEHASFVHNVAAKDGGGMLADSGAQVTLHQVWFDRNEAYYGGGFYSDGTLTGDDLLFVDNRAVFGGGFEVHDSPATLDHVAVLSNSASSSGGGGYVIGGSLDVTNAVFAGNSGANYSGALDLSLTTVRLDQTVMYGNSAALGSAVGLADCTLEVVGSIVAENPATYSWGVGFYDRLDDTAPSTLFQTASLTSDPGFLVSTDDAMDPWAWDFHLEHTTSLAVDAGLGIDPDGSTADIGAYGGPGADSWDLDGDGVPSWWHPGAWDAKTDAKTDCDDLDETVAGC
jgi:hypothetical protein